jgi:hypothetical protein
MAVAYSSTPLYKKLGLKNGMNTMFINPPEDYVNQLKKDIDIVHSEAPFDYVQLFTNSKKEFTGANLARLKNHLKKDGILWISWYKKASGKQTELTEDIVRGTALKTGLVDVKVCSVDEDWSGLKLVFRLKDR